MQFLQETNYYFHFCIFFLYFKKKVAIHDFKSDSKKFVTQNGDIFWYKILHFTEIKYLLTDNKIQQLHQYKFKN
jgi:hypothetical protein